MELFIVEWEGVGFYAAKQPTYDWCFTKDILKAAVYKTEKAAKERACGDKFGSGHHMRPYRLVKVDGNRMVLYTPPEFINPTVERENIRSAKELDKGPKITLGSLLKKPVLGK